MRIIPCFCLATISCIAFAQKQRSFTFDYAANVYKGDFSTSQAFRNSFVFGIKLNKDKFLTGEFQARIGAVSAQSISTQDPIVSYVKTNFFALNYGLNFRLFQVKEKFDLTISQGFGVIRYNPKNEKGEDLIAISSTRKKGESFSNVAIVFPTKLSLNYYSNYGVNYAFNTGFLNTRTDYLDNLSELSDSNTKDNIFFMGIGVEIDL